MSRLEQDMIQSKLKAAIQNHQMLVVKLKSDNENVAFKKRRAELQEEIKRLSEEHKKMVVKVRENLVKSISQAHSEAAQPNTNAPSVGQTITAIGQPRLVSFPTQGGATILPMGMVAVPIAHMQKPAMGMAIHPAGVTALTQAANISIIPTGIINSTCNLNFATLNGGSTLALNNVGSNIGPYCGAVAQSFPPGGPASLGNSTILSAAAGGILQSSCPSSVASSSSSSSSINTNTSSSCGASTGATAPPIGVLPNSSINLNNFTNMTSLIINNSIGSNHPLVINSSINNKTSTTTATITSSSSVNSSFDKSVAIPTTIASACSSVSSNGGSGFLVCPVPSLPAQSSAPSLVLSTSFPQQPLVQPQLLQQQQQQIIQLIQQQQSPPHNLQQQHTLQAHLPPPPPPPPPPPQQRLSSQLPIKVPQYTASHIRHAVSTASAQHNSTVPSPSTSVGPQTKMSTNASVSNVRPLTSGHKNCSAPTIPVKNSSLSNGNHVAKETKDNQIKPSTAKQAKTAQQKLQKQPKEKVLQATKEKETKEPETKPLSAEDKEKIKFMRVLDLHTPEAVREILLRRGERKRRTTANPNYSFGFEISRRDRNVTAWTDIPVKKARTNKSKVESTAGGWSDSTNGPLHLQWASSKASKQSDNHDDYCAACSKGGSLLMCSTCRLVYHLDCLNPPLTEAPKYAWSCPQCLVSGKGLANLSSDARKRVNSYIARKADKEDEWKKLQKKSREIKTEKSFLDRRLQEVSSKIQEQKHLQSKLSKQEQKIQEDLNKLSGFVNMIRESRSAEHVAANLVQANCS